MTDTDGDLLSCLRGGRVGAGALFGLPSGTLRSALPHAVVAGLPPGSGGATRDVLLDGSLTFDPTLLKIEKEVDAETVLALLFFREGSCGGGNDAAGDAGMTGDAALGFGFGVEKSKASRLLP